MMKDEAEEWINTPTHRHTHSRQTSKEQLQHQQPTLSTFVPSISDNLDKALRSSRVNVQKHKSCIPTVVAPKHIHRKSR